MKTKFNDETSINVKDGVKFITFNKLSEIPFIKHAFSTKEGGVSENEFATMNLSFFRGDKEESVKENYERFFKAIGCELSSVILSDQIHKTNVFKVTQETLDTMPTDTKKRILKGMDGMITNVPNVPLMTFYADCVPLYFVDTVNKAIGLSHSGWRGTVGGIAKNTIEAMTREYNTNPKDIVAVVGPSICKNCYEVSKDVVDEVKKAYDNILDIDNVCIPKDNGKYLLDLWILNKMIIKSIGVLEDNIVISNVCTSCNSDWLYSHRVTNGKRGNLAAVMEII